MLSPMLARNGTWRETQATKASWPIKGVAGNGIWCRGCEQFATIRAGASGGSDDSSAARRAADILGLSCAQSRPQQQQANGSSNKAACSNCVFACTPAPVASARQRWLAVMCTCACNVVTRAQAVPSYPALFWQESAPAQNRGPRAAAAHRTHLTELHQASAPSSIQVMAVAAQREPPLLSTHSPSPDFRIWTVTSTTVTLGGRSWTLWGTLLLHGGRCEPSGALFRASFLRDWVTDHQGTDVTPHQKTGFLNLRGKVSLRNGRQGPNYSLACIQNNNREGATKGRLTDFL